MTLLETEQRRSRRAQHAHTKQRKRKRKRSALQAPLPFLPHTGELHDQQVLSFRQWCSLSGFSPRTGARILASGNGPVVTQLSEKRVGITVGNNRQWQASRAR